MNEIVRRLFRLSFFQFVITNWNYFPLFHIIEMPIYIDIIDFIAIIKNNSVDAVNLSIYYW